MVSALFSSIRTSTQSTFRQNLHSPNRTSYIIDDSTFTSLSVMDGNGTRDLLFPSFFRAHTARQSHLSLLHSLLYGVSIASLDRSHRLRNQRKESSQRRLRAALPRLFKFLRFSFCFLSELLSILLNPDVSRAPLDRVKDAIAYIAESVTTPQITLGVPSFFFFLLIPRSTCSKSKRRARFRGDSHL